jgi:serine palmitoyltransferase
MGTFTKSFSGMGGYIAGSKELIASLKATSAGLLYHTSISPIITKQVLTAFRVIMGEDGTDIGIKKINALRDNSNFFREGMRKLGAQIIGDDDSPIIPMMIYLPSKVSAFSRLCLERGLAVVVVGFPATSVVMSRARFCISAGHTREDLTKALQIIEDVATQINLRYGLSVMG